MRYVMNAVPYKMYIFSTDVASRPTPYCGRVKTLPYK